MKKYYKLNRCLFRISDGELKVKSGYSNVWMSVPSNIKNKEGKYLMTPEEFLQSKGFKEESPEETTFGN